MFDALAESLSVLLAHQRVRMIVDTGGWSAWWRPHILGLAAQLSSGSPSSLELWGWDSDRGSIAGACADPWLSTAGTTPEDPSQSAAVLVLLSDCAGRAWADPAGPSQVCAWGSQPLLFAPLTPRRLHWRTGIEQLAWGEIPTPGPYAPANSYTIKFPLFDDSVLPHQTMRLVLPVVGPTSTTSKLLSWLQGKPGARLVGKAGTEHSAPWLGLRDTRARPATPAEEARQLFNYVSPQAREFMQSLSAVPLSMRTLRALQRERDASDTTEFIPVYAILSVSIGGTDHGSTTVQRACGTSGQGVGLHEPDRSGVSGVGCPLRAGLHRAYERVATGRQTAREACV